MKFTDLTQIVGENLIAHKMRAFLTIIGIAIGIAAVIAVVAIGQGGQAVILQQIESTGSSRYFELPSMPPKGRRPRSTPSPCRMCP
jgi:putative ABC transport system permease protein